ncbi:hypothetical protein QQS21_007172 [Conoideocrella luteorostrata]|uniref:Major facilitator superfamily (MFS) profile domain-containing protein n=1 Tax=Conoideocrella luteorostrata TaxID=1105319 RepID=A0AAJ0CP36_9HYPO|nr:hypothetical protein QQS21_007172 [Conoideocrella luteorostrata]
MSVEENLYSTGIPKQIESPSLSARQPREQLTVQESAQDSAAIDEAIYPSGIRLWMAVASCCIVSFLHGLDLTIVAATVPSLTNHFRTVADIGWYSSAYSLMTASFSFLIGKLFAVTSWMFILGRAVAGVGSVGLVTGSYMIVTQSFSSQMRPMWTTVVGSSQFIGIVSAPLLGGALIDWVGWRGCFGINIPLGAIALVTVKFGFQDLALIPDAELSWTYKLKRFDWVVLAPVASGLLTTIRLDEGVVKVACLLGFLGLATGLGIQTPILALQTILKTKDLPIGIATNTFGATMGNAVWIVVSATVFQNRLVSEIAVHSPSVNATQLSSAGLSEIGEIVGRDRLRDVLLGYDEAVTQTLYLPVGLGVATILGSIFMEWHSMKNKED